MTLASPYLAPGFYDKALEEGRHRDIVGGRWQETVEIQMRILEAEGLRPHHRLLDIGCGCLRLGHEALRYLEPGHYWGTDASAALMQRGWEAELTDEDRARLPLSHLIEDSAFEFPSVPGDITHAMAWGLFTHLPESEMRPALMSVRARFPDLQKLLLTVFLAPDGHEGSLRQPDGVVTHPDRPPWHRKAGAVEADALAAGFRPDWREWRLPRGQRLAVLIPSALSE